MYMSRPLAFNIPVLPTEACPRTTTLNGLPMPCICPDRLNFLGTDVFLCNVLSFGDDDADVEDVDDVTDDDDDDDDIDMLTVAKLISMQCLFY